MTTDSHPPLNVTVTDQQQCKKQLQIEIPAELVRAETDKIATDLARQVNVPGFRRGHVPKSVIKTRFRKELRDEMLSHLLPHALGDAIREKELKVVGEPEIDDLKFGDDESINLTVTVEVAPEFELSNYKAIPVQKRVFKVADEDVDKTIKRLREGQAELVPVEDRPAQVGDIATANITGQISPAAAEAAQTEEGSQAETSEAGSDSSEGEPVPEDSSQESSALEVSGEEVKQQDVEIEIGGEGVLKEFTEALTGARPGDVRTFTVAYPQDYSNTRYAGRSASYTIEVTAIRAKELPDLDEEFARSVDEKFNSVDEMRAGVRTTLEEEASHRSEEGLRPAVMEQLVDRNRFDVPEAIVEKHIDSRMNMFFRQLMGQGIDPRKLKLDWDSMRESHRERAEREVRGMFILDRIARSEEIEVSEEELNQELEQYAESAGQDIASLKARLTKEDALDSIREQVRHRKALDLVIASADTRIEEVGLGGEDTAIDNESGQAEQKA